MIHVETIGDAVKTKIGQADAEMLVCESSTAVSSVVQAIYGRAKEDSGVDADFMAKATFIEIVHLAAKTIESKIGVDVLDVEAKDEDSEDEDVIAREIPKDSDVGKALMELLGITDKDTDDTADDETEDDIPDFLF